MGNRHIKINDNDNVAITVNAIPAGTIVIDDILANQDIPQGHKLALCNIEEDQPIIRYGVTLGYALHSIKKGDWINEHMLELPTPPALDEMQFATNLVTDLPEPPARTFMGYPNKDGKYAGTRNILGIVTTVQCVTGVLNNAVKRIKKELLPKYPNIDGVVAINHAYGCGVAINAHEAKIPIRMLQNMVKHPNFGVETMIISLGCEKLTLEMLLDEEYNTSENVVTFQNEMGHQAIMAEIMKMAENKLKRLNERVRVELPLSQLCIGLQCGGSDAFSGVTANPSAGYAADMLVNAGATVMFSEVTEVRDGVHIIAERCVNEEVGKKLADEMVWYDQYLNNGQVDRSANPTPGNKKGGLSNIVEKAMGSIAKSGSSPIVEVLSPGERPTKKGMIFAATPASDFVCGSCQLSSGMTLQVFMTGRGTPYGLEAAPVIKVCSRDDMKNMWQDLIDVNAGPIATGEATIQEIGTQLFNEIIDVASGRKQTFAEQYEIYNDFTLFNPAPIT
ncbi:galactarate dehydratase [Neobacillus sp. 179-C4.2 HS]|uniref:Galactarate dehydratase n=1 Tax=Neobacillus driksii TaxID=3035913 RepID=A0ABV4Z1P8_9BACI|nr:galactarate dehydratase [Neobacillus sp. 179.-C4.2 HS]MDP5195210.1 galactarate dehydratase [Neobacillus sp. 179.-C4.2 HS]